MALNPVLAVETAAKCKHANCAGAIGDYKAGLLRFAVNLLNGTDNCTLCKASHQIFPSNSAFFLCHVLPVHAFFFFLSHSPSCFNFGCSIGKN